MAESSLYLNAYEPLFPFDQLRQKLSWLPGYLASHLSEDDSDASLLNTVLVFTRARTAALFHMGNWNQVHHLAKHLNAAAQAVGASYHKLELVRFGGMFFVTCHRSPR